jgi:hypothetical protein
MLVHVLAHRPAVPRPAARGQQGRSQAARGVRAVPSHTGNLFPGIAAVFARHGFEVVARRKPDRPVMRKFLGTPGQD